MSQYRSAPQRVEFVLDLTCIHSYLGFTRFERVVRRRRAKGAEIEVVFLPFQVTPGAPTTGEPLSQTHQRDFGARAPALVANMRGVGARDGLDFNFDRAVFVNTFEAHRLLTAAGRQGLGEPMAERLFRAYLTDGANIGDQDVLDRLAAEVGVRQNDGDADDLRAELARVRGLGIHAVPFLRFENGVELTGAQPENTYAEAFSARINRVG